MKLVVIFLELVLTHLEKRQNIKIIKKQHPKLTTNDCVGIVRMFPFILNRRRVFLYESMYLTENFISEMVLDLSVFSCRIHPIRKMLKSSRKILLTRFNVILVVHASFYKSIGESVNNKIRIRSNVKILFSFPLSFT